MMKIKIDKKYTADYQIDRVKEAIKSFKEVFTENDLLAMFRSEFDWHDNWCCEIVNCEIRAFDAGTFYNNETTFAIEMLLEGFSEVDKIRFYYTTGFGVNIAKDMHTIKVYKEV